MLGNIVRYTVMGLGIAFFAASVAGMWWIWIESDDGFMFVAASLATMVFLGWLFGMREIRV